MHRVVGYAFTVLLVVGLTVGSGGYTTAGLTRHADLGTVPDEAAYLGYQAGCSGDVLTVTVTNRFRTTPLRVTVASNGQSKTTTLGGNTGPMRTRLRFDHVDTDGTVAVRAHVPGGGVVIELTRPVPDTCDPAPIEWVAFCGGEAVSPPSIEKRSPGGPTVIAWNATGIERVVYRAGERQYRFAPGDTTILGSGHGTVRDGPIGEGSAGTPSCAAVNSSHVHEFSFNRTTGSFEHES